jgi:hypothetical protein
LLRARWVTSTSWPATMRWPTRGVALGLGAACQVTVPLPVPPPGPTTDSHGAFEVADHAQPVLVVTETLPLPPAALTCALSGATP